MTASFASPVDLARVQHVFVSDVSTPASDQQRTFGVALISFANSATTYSVFPATMDPYIAVEPDSQGECIDVIGPPVMAAADVPPDSVPPSKYTTLLDYGYDGADKSRLAVYVCDKSSKWLAVAHSLKSIGIPFFLTSDINRAIQFSAVFVYPYAPPNAADATTLIAHMNNGNSVIFSQLASSYYTAACGVTEFGERSTAMSYISFVPASSGPTATFVEDPERNIKIWDDWDNIGKSMRVYTVASDVTVLARYKHRADSGVDELMTDLASIFSRETPNEGSCTSLFGDIGQLASASHTNKMGGTGRAYSSTYDPGIDMFWRLIRNIYYQSQQVVTLHPIMSGKKLAIVITHDCDANECVTCFHPIMLF